MLQSSDIEGALAGTIFHGKLHFFEEVESTNTLAMEAASIGAAEGTVFIARSQTAGRGRGGHAWHSEPNAGLYFSMVLRPEVARERISAQESLWLSLLAGVAVHAGVRGPAGIEADVKWPNDLLIGRKKFCGILTELQTAAKQVDYAVVGIGINVNHQKFPDDLAEIATSLQIASGHMLDANAVLASVLRAFDREYREFLVHGGEALIPKLERISTWIRGKRVHVPEQGGYNGVTAGLDPRGFLRVDAEGVMRTALSGGITAIE